MKNFDEIKLAKELIKFTIKTEDKGIMRFLSKKLSLIDLNVKLSNQKDWILKLL